MNSNTSTMRATIAILTNTFSESGGLSWVSRSSRFCSCWVRESVRLYEKCGDAFRMFWLHVNKIHLLGSDRVGCLQCLPLYILVIHIVLFACVHWLFFLTLRL
jgi:hypothetical protein